MAKDELEKHILTRSYSSEAQIIELLAARYSSSGEQRPVLILSPTGSSKPAEKTKSLLHTETPAKEDRDGHYKARKSSTRLELKRYISATLRSQKKVAQMLRKTSANSDKQLIKRLLEKHNIPLFEDFLGINQLWQEYMGELLFNHKLDGKSKAKSESENSKEDAARHTPIPSLTQLLPKLSSADYSGCFVTVIRSRNTQLVGTRGIVVWDTQHLFILCVPRCEDSKEWLEQTEGSFSGRQQVGGLRVVPKTGTMFAFDVNVGDHESLGFTIVGSRFEFRNVERSARKFKNHPVEDI